MEHRHSPQPDHRGARSPSRQRRPDELPGHRAARHQEPQSGLPLGLLRHLLCRPGEPRGRSATSSTSPQGHTASCIDECNYIWTGGPARRDDQAYLGPFTPGGRGDGGRSGSRISETRPSRSRSRADRPLAQRRADRLLARRRRRRERDRVDERPRRPAGLRDQGPLARSAHRHDAERQAVGSDPDRRRRHRRWPTVSPSRRPTSSTTRPAARRRDQGRGSPGRERRRHDRGGLHRPVQRERPHRRRGHHRLARRRARDQLDAGAAVPDERAERLPPDPGRGHDDLSEPVVLRALLRGLGVDGRRGVVRRRGCA